MELKRRLDFKYVLIGLYIFAFLIYLIVGLQPAEAVNMDISTELSIPSIDLTSDVTTLSLGKDGLDTPDTIVGRYSKNINNTLLIGHSSTVFQNLKDVKVGDLISYDLGEYTIVSTEVFRKIDIDMNDVLSKRDVETIVIMTCAGELYDDGDASHRLIVTAIKN